MNEPLFCLMGPTASGKTALALQLAKYFPIEIISVDSALVYREMDIGTAKPGLAERQQVAHHGIDLINPDEVYSAAQFCASVDSLVPEIRQRQNIPLLVGGSMMYFKALQHGLAPLPAADATLRQHLLGEAQQWGWPHLHARLQQIDPLIAARIEPQDQQRIQRALEVYMLTGKPLSSWQQEKTADAAPHFVNIMILPAHRPWLHQRIAQRFEQMIAQGFLQEVQQLCQRWPGALDKPAMRMVGYRQAIDYYTHQDFALFMDKGIAATRQLAKRQLTWLRHWPKGHILDPNKEDLLAASIALLQNAGACRTTASR
ncbi:MAG: tRNA (adenosine(37)-N6)-dimethylallyltransferase MiaA [Legionellaceae bacterium]|nr:tRNA (adenosine(37)-N6)-dimethylallyltransferase MiaA [Legionellaceae bacterium]